MLLTRRWEVSGALQYTQDAQLMGVTYSPSGAEIGVGAATGQINLEDSTWNAPFLIKWYKVTIATNFMGLIYQCYGDLDDASVLGQFDLSNEEFYQGLKKYRMTGTAGGVTVMRFSAKWNKKGKKWATPPIKMGTPNAAGNYFHIGIRNEEFTAQPVDQKFLSVIEMGVHRLS